MEAAAAKFIGAGLAVFPLAGAAIGIGAIGTALLLGSARNPLVAKTLFGYAIFGIALAEATGLFALLVSLIILFAF